MPSRSAPAPLAPWRRLLAVVLALAWLSLALAGAHDEWHRRLHAAQGDAGHDADCALCSMASGGCDAPAAALAAEPPAVTAVFRSPAPARDPFLPLVSRRCAPSRGPPFVSLTSV